LATVFPTGRAPWAKSRVAALIVVLAALLDPAAPFAPAHGAAQDAPAPVNSEASPEARALLEYLYHVSGRGILAGQHDYNSDMGRWSGRAEAITGKAPMVWGTDFYWSAGEDPGDRVVEEAIRRHQAGRIVTLMWHVGRPMDDPPYPWAESVQAELTDEEWRELVTPGTGLHRRWQAQVDRLARHLARLRDAGVPVLWRPYHEMNGVWFWWGARPGPDGFPRLWRMLYDRLVHHHGLDNLIWVWNANAPRDIPQDQARPYAGFYPGHDMVDVLATDVYHFDYEQRDYEELLALAEGRPIALGEVGELPKPEILDAQPAWTWFMVWSSWLESANTEDRVRAVYDYPRTITADEAGWPRSGPPAFRPD
jgi:mannan endo-1,4-beta-mannosidase